MTWQTASLLLCFLAFSCGQEGSRSGSHDFGTWGDWGQPSACSRTCGGGVLHRTRKCHHGVPGLSRGCQGEDITYESCNTQPCPSGLESFRSVQCSRFNSPVSTWLPHDTEESKQCALVCQERETGRVQKLQDRVVDGTECETAQGLGICLAGACKAVGCDRRLDSRTKEDSCLVCGGQGDSCQTYSGTLTDRAMTVGQNSIATIPAGSTTITVRQVSSGQASLSLIGGDGVVYLDSRLLPLDESVVMAAGAKVSYRRSVLAGGAKSVVVSARGPTDTTLHIKVNYTSHQTGVEYEYSVPKARVLESNPNQPFTWIFGAWTSCSKECGDGYQLRAVSCIDRRSGASVDDSKCGMASKPDIRQACNVKPCGTASNLYRWLPGHWGKCSVECGVGEQVQEMYCVESGPGGDTVYVRDELCQRYSDKPPVYKRACEGEGEHCPYWATYAWSECSVTCGYGIQTRRVLCQRDPEDPQGEPETVEESLCTEERPDTHMVCQLPACADGSNAHGMVQVEDRDDDCEGSVYKCCPDGMTAATGPNFAGCPTRAPANTNVCLLEPERGRCSDFSIKWNFVPQEGECRRFWYGGCEGNANRFDTEDECRARCAPQGGQVVKAKEDCTARTYGCCPDGVTAARGPNYLGCPSTRPVDNSCQRSRFGCCPDGVTPATGPQQRGCDDGSEDDEDNRTPGGQDTSQDCRRTRYGCCQDGVAAARGPNKKGCGTAASSSSGTNDTGVVASGGRAEAGGPAEKKRACEQSYYGCCTDTDVAATGPNQEGCVSGAEFHPEVCSIPAERGSCSDYSVKWYYNSTFSRCERFWYGGCGGNGNRFDTEAACRAGCVDLAGPAVCHLAAETGPCRASHRRFFYNHKVGKCEQFIYGGCRGNANRFLTMEDCGRRCAGAGVASSSSSRDTATAQTGPSGERLVPSHHVDSCRHTQYGCCEDGVTAARGPNMQDCEEEGSGRDGDCGVMRYGCCPDGVTAAAGLNQRGCPTSVPETTRPTPKTTPKTTPSTPTTPTADAGGDRCSKSSDRGPCSNYVVRWFHNATRKECAQFWYGGCQGNDNRFENRDECEAECTATEAPVTEDPDFVSICDMPMEEGTCRSRLPRWYYSPLDRQCRLFFYTGCHGNENNFQTLPECRQTCMGIAPTTIITTTTTTPAPHTFMPPPVKSKLTMTGSDSVREGEELRLTCRAEGPTTPSDIEWFANGKPVRSEPGTAAVTLRAVPSQHALVSELLIPRARSEHTALYRCRSVPFVDEQRKNVVVGTEMTARPTTTLPPVKTFLPDRTASNPQEVCRLPQAVGSCRGYFRRWYYDASLQQCREFVYGGCEGNSNSFESQKMCEDYCRPQGLVPSRLSAEEVCNQPSVVGNCRGNFPRWYYDAVTRTCRTFVYGGCGANSNNFVSERDCLKYCRREETGTRVVDISTDPSVVCQLPVKTGNCGLRIPRYHYNAEKGKCLRFEFSGCDSNSNNFESEWTCNRYCRSEDICNLPQVVGSCRGSFTRYYHDPTTKTCKQFVFGGCHGNLNNFGTLEACQSKCMVVSGREVVPATKTKEACYLRPEQGRCQGSYLQWYHDPQNRRCQRFVYTGCEGNANRFATQEECEQLCSPRVDVVLTPAPPQPGAGVCALAMDRGSLCATWKVVWYYNASRGLCTRFYYGGCGGNDNRFSSEEECQTRCVLRTEGPTTTTTPAPRRHRCENSRYGCCPDGVTVAIDYSHSNCRDDRVVVGPASDGDVREVLVNRGATAFIHCYSPGSAISWYREGFYLSSDDRFTIFNNGTLAIRTVDDDVAEEYTCRVNDGNNIAQNYRYIVHIKVPLNILPGPPTVTVGPGENAYFHCQASGTPPPTVQWTFQGIPVRSGGPYTAYYNGSLTVSGVTPREAGDYKCTAQNGVDTPVSRTATLRLAKELRAVVRNHGNGTFYEGETGRLSCMVSGYPTPTLSWQKDGRPLGVESSEKVYMEGDDLVLRQMSVEDSGLYECVAKNSLAMAKHSTYIQVRPPALHEACVDKHPRCNTIVKAQLCGHVLFWKQCCKSCKTKDQLGKAMSPRTRG